MALVLASSLAVIAHGLVRQEQPDTPVSFFQPSLGAREVLMRSRVFSAQREGYLARLGEVAGNEGAWWANEWALEHLFGFQGTQKENAVASQGTHKVDVVSEDFVDESTGESSQESFTQDDYEEAVGSNSMQDFATRVADAEGLEVVRANAFNVFLKWYDGTCQKQSYDALVAAMHLCVVNGAMCGDSIVAKGTNLWDQSAVALSQFTKKVLSKHVRRGASESRRSANRSKVVTTTSKLNSTSLERIVNAGTALRAKSAVKTKPSAGVSKVVNTTSTNKLNSTSLKRGVKAGNKLRTKKSAVRTRRSAGVGATAPLNEDGYAMVADAKNSEQMCVFTRRVISKEKLVLTDEGSLDSFCTWYSGELTRQSYEALVAELHVSAERPVECGGSWLEKVES